jgi:hypothetical protein
MKRKTKVTEKYYVIEKDGKFYSDFDENSSVLFVDTPDEAYIFRNKDPADFHLAEYHSRFASGFKVVEIIEEKIVTFTWTIK